MHKPTICLFGAGAVGLAVYSRLHDGGFPVRMWNRTPHKIAQLLNQGTIDENAVASGTMEDIIQEHDVLVTSMGDNSAIQETLLDADWAHALKGKTAINLSTVSAYRSCGFETAFHAHNASFLELALLGTISDIHQGVARVLVGSERSEFRKNKFLIDTISINNQYIGKCGEATAIHLALQQLNVSMLNAFANSISLLNQQQNAIEVFMQLLRDSPLYSALFDQKLPRLETRDYTEPGYSVQYMLQILEMFMEDAHEQQLNIDTADIIKSQLSLAKAKGQGELDNAAMYDVISPVRKQDSSDI